jgi:hypothetical protein
MGGHPRIQAAADAGESAHVFELARHPENRKLKRGLFRRFSFFCVLLRI